MYDVNVEHFGWNRQPSENARDYVARVWKDDYLQTFSNNAFCDMSFDSSMKINDKCIPISSCYYFSYTTGIETKVSNNRSHFELNPEITHASNDVIGFDKINSSERLKWQDIPREANNATMFEMAISFIKKSTDFFTICKNFMQTSKIIIPKLYEDQQNDSNWDALKIEEQRYYEDNDSLVARVSQEFPKMSHNFTKLSSEEKPWGKKNPQQFNWEDNPRLTKFDKGRWFYSNIENSYHLDLAGWPEVWIMKFLRVVFGVEYRYQFFKQLFERIYSLEFN